MKKIFALVVLVVAFALSAFAQSHETFLGVPMNGSLRQFTNRLASQQGLSLVEADDENDVYTMSGKFLGYSDSEFYIFCNENSKQVYKVDVYLPKSSSWSAIKKLYKKVVNQYRQNSYFDFQKETAEFESPYYEGDGYETQAVEADKVNYSAVFYTQPGFLVVSISKFMQVKLTFIDDRNNPYNDDNSSSNNNTTNNSGNRNVDITNSTSMMFMGIPMTGNINTFAQRLVNEKGCRIINTDTEHVISLRGTFTGKDAEFYVFGTPVTDQVWSVDVYLPELSTWKAIKREYLNYKERFDTKYSLNANYAGFGDPYSEGDGKEVEGVRAEKCAYSSFYDAPGGNIMLQISKYMQVQMSYEDAANLARRDAERNGTDFDSDGGGIRSSDSDI